MRYLLCVMIFAAGMGSGAFAGDFEGAANAYNKKDYVGAAESYRKSADPGNASAQCHLAMMYYNGEGVAQDSEQARFWLRKP